MPVQTQKKLKSNDFVNYYRLKGGTEWVKPTKITDFQESLNPNVIEAKYITDDGPSKNLESYAPSHTAPADLFHGEAGFEFFFPFYKELKIGEDAKIEHLMVYMFKETAGETPSYEARMGEYTVVVNTMDIANAKMDMNIQSAGDIKQGTVTFTDGQPSFTPKVA